MKFNKYKAIILLFMIILAEGFEIHRKGRLNMRNKLGAKSKVKYHKVEKSSRKGRYRSHHKRQNGVCQEGFGFKGGQLADLPNLTKEALQEKSNKAKEANTGEEKKDVDDTFDNIFGKIWSKMSNEFLNVAIGDYNGSQVSGLTSFTCENFPIAQTQTVGILGLFIRLPGCDPAAPLGTEIKICLMFDRCGTFGLSMNNGLLTCILAAAGAGTAGISLVIAKIIQVVDNAAFAFSWHQKLERQVNMTTVVPETENTPAVLQEATRTLKGHIHFGVGLVFPLPDEPKIGNKTLSQIFELQIKPSILFSFGNNIGNTIKEIVDATIAGANLQSFYNILKRSGIEASFHITGTFKVKTKELSYGFLPDIELNLPSIYFLITTGGGASGLETGIYLKLDINLGDILAAILENLLWPYTAVLKAIGFDIPKIELPALNFSFNLVMNVKYLGFTFHSSLFTAKCLYSIEIGKGGCEFETRIGAALKKLFTGLVDAGKMLLMEVDRLFQELGKVIGVITGLITDAIVKTAEAVKQFFTDIGKAFNNALEWVGGAVIQVAETLKSAAQAVWNWFTSWRRRKIRRMLRMQRLKKLRKMKKLRRMRRRYH